MDLCHCSGQIATSTTLHHHFARRGVHGGSQCWNDLGHCFEWPGGVRCCAAQLNTASSWGAGAGGVTWTVFVLIKEATTVCDSVLPLDPTVILMASNGFNRGRHPAAQGGNSAGCFLEILILMGWYQGPKWETPQPNHSTKKSLHIVAFFSLAIGWGNAAAK